MKLQNKLGSAIFRTSFGHLSDILIIFCKNQTKIRPLGFPGNLFVGIKPLNKSQREIRQIGAINSSYTRGYLTKKNKRSFYHYFSFTKTQKKKKRCIAKLTHNNRFIVRLKQRRPYFHMSTYRDCSNVSVYFKSIEEAISFQ